MNADSKNGTLFPGKKSFFRRVWWLWVISGILVLLFFFTLPKNISGNIGTADLRQRAEAAFQKGTTITDPANDWLSTGSPGDNPSFYPVAASDIISMTFAADDDYLYINIQTGGIPPTTARENPTFNGDNIKNIYFDIALDTDNNAKTGVRGDGGAEAFVCSTYTQDNNFNYFADTQSYWYGPTGIEEPEDLRYRVRDGKPAGKWGGFGYDYKILVIPLNDIGITKSQEITITAWAEVKSEKYHHASFDILGTGNQNYFGSFGIRIKLIND